MMYWDLPDDGALFRCEDCSELFHHSMVYATRTPNGERGLVCRECIDEWWKKRAQYKGVLKDGDSNWFTE